MWFGTRFLARPKVENSHVKPKARCTRNFVACSLSLQALSLNFRAHVAISRIHVSKLHYNLHSKFIICNKALDPHPKKLRPLTRTFAYSESLLLRCGTSCPLCCRESRDRKKKVGHSSMSLKFGLQCMLPHIK
jgi:hypothetical protein